MSRVIYTNPCRSRSSRSYRPNQPQPANSAGLNKMLDVVESASGGLSVLMATREPSQRTIMAAYHLPKM
jgi:hypothetical protein